MTDKCISIALAYIDLLFLTEQLNRLARHLSQTWVLWRRLVQQHLQLKQVIAASISDLDAFSLEKAS